MKEKFKKLYIWLSKEILTKDMIIYVLVAELIFWSPAIFCVVMALFNAWWWTAFSAIVAFWTMPIFTPAIALQVGLAVGLKQLHKKLKRR